MTDTSVDAPGPSGQALNDLPELGEIRPANGARLTLNDRDGEPLLLRHRAGSWADQGPSIAATVKLDESGGVADFEWDWWHRENRVRWKGEVEAWARNLIEGTP